MKQKKIRIKHFIDSGFKDFSFGNCIRHIPSIKDGFKPSQRKVIYGMQVRGENSSELQIDRYAAFIASVTDYHHGVSSLEDTMINMAKNYSGSNNINLLMPNGQFGSRLDKESSSPRYILTEFSKNFRKIFKKEDDGILEHHMIENGEKIEPKSYVPLLPITLINGANGQGTGHATNIFNYNPLEIRDMIVQLVNGKSIKNNTLIPWYKGFKGKIEKNKETFQIVITGILKVVNTTTIHITELPIGTYLEKYKSILNTLEDDGFIKDYESGGSTEDGFEFIINVPRSTTALDEETLYQKFKLIAKDTENFTLWNVNNQIQKYIYPEEIIREFTTWRLGRYEDRRQMLINKTKIDITWSNMKIKFIQYYLKNTKLFKDTSKAELVKILEPLFPEYERLLSQSIWSLTKDKITELENELVKQKVYLTELEENTAKSMYLRELKEFTI
jgi:DNA topoisomerase-2